MRRAAEWAALGTIIVLSAWLWRTPGSPDVGIWSTWIESAQRLGPRAGYAASVHDYPPGSTTLLWVAASLGERFGLDSLSVLKALVSVFLTAATALVLAWTRRPLLAAFTHAALAVGAVGLVYLDVLAAPLLLGAIWAASGGRTRLALGLFFAACAIKWQPVIVAPFVIAYACSIRARGTTVARSLAGVLAAAVLATGLLVAVFGFHVLESFYRATGHKQLSANALNVGWIATWLLHLVDPARWGPLVDGRVGIIVPHHSVLVPIFKLTAGVTYLWVLRRYVRTGDRSVAAMLRHATVGYLAYFALNAGVHENHLLMPVVLAIALTALEPRWLWAAIVIAAGANANLVAFYGIDGLDSGIHRLAGVDVTVWMAMANVAALVATASRLIDGSAATLPAKGTPT